MTQMELLERSPGATQAGHWCALRVDCVICGEAMVPDLDPSVHLWHCSGCRRMLHYCAYDLSGLSRCPDKSCKKVSGGRVGDAWVGDCGHVWRNGADPAAAARAERFAQVRTPTPSAPAASMPPPPEPAGAKRPLWHSPSAANTFLECPRRYFFRYVLGRKVPPGRDAFVGSFVHGVLESAAKARLAGDLELSAQPNVAYDQLVEIAVSLRGTKLYCRHEIWPTFEPLDADLWAEITYLLWMWVCSEDTLDSVVGTELKLSVPIQGVPFFGFVDRLDHDETGVAVEIVDYKKGKAGSAKFQPSKMRQILWYAAAIEAQEDVLVAGARLVHLGGRVEPPSVVRADMADLGAAVETFVGTWTKIGERLVSGDWPAEPGPLCAWCDYVADCDEGRVKLSNLTHAKGSTGIQAKAKLSELNQP